ncbi:hypothetical protein [Gayadomonas joobiniege]|uniref:hypothetical protein n=1 Tax=Gayadomonas joobiniege TaxID=1234606 RepID=UPI000474DA0D|nr:hypothetical protein [Gayadomonas joobiniege]
MRITKPFWVVLFIFTLVACGDPMKAKIENQLNFAELQMEKLAQGLEAGQIRNANLIKEYARQLSEKMPEQRVLVQELAKDAGTSGPMFLNLKDRLQTAKSQPQAFSSSQERLVELENIYQAASRELYNDALSDPLNVLADLSGGLLPRVNSISQAASLQSNQAENYGAGSQLIGNPAYGQWSTDSSGMSFWEWYGMYALISNITDAIGGRRGRVYYGDWARGRNYSYYHDYGRYRYSSPKTVRQQNQIEQKAKKNYRGGTFTSAYAKNRTGAAQISSASRTAQKQKTQFKSQYATKNTSSSAKKPSSTSSFRSSSSGFRSGGFGGK